MVDRLIVPNWYLHLRASRLAADVMGCEMSELREAVLIYKLAEGRSKFVTGHIACKPRTRETFEQQWRFVTVLRDPVKRWISEFVYNTYGTQEWARNTLPVEQYAESPAGVTTGARYIEYFSTWRPGDAIAEHHVDSAVSNLRRFAAVGVLDDMPAFANMLSEMLDRTVKIPHLNRSPQRERSAEIMRNPELLEKIRTLCSWDTAVYERVKSAGLVTAEHVRKADVAATAQ